MPSTLSPDRLRRALSRGPVEAAYLIAGPEVILKDEALSVLLDHCLDPGLRDFNLDLLSAQQLEPEQLAAVAATLPMMSERRVVVVRDLEAWKRKTKARQAAVQVLEHPHAETVIVLVQGGDDPPDADFARHAVVIDCSAPSGEALDAWLDARLAAAGVALEADAREHLLRATGAELGLLAAEVQKLSGLAVTGPIDRETVGAMVGVRFGETPDDWRDAILRDDTATALGLVPQLLGVSGNSGVALVSRLGSSLLVLRWARAAAAGRKLRGRALAEAVKRLCFGTRPQVGSYDPFSRLVSDVVATWPEARTRAALADILAADVALKSTSITDETGIVTELTLRLATSGARKAA
jgi:DNA polymerase-3 subunit delta